MPFLFSTLLLFDIITFRHFSFRPKLGESICAYDHSYTLSSYVVKTEKNKPLCTGFEPGSRYPRCRSLATQLYANYPYSFLIFSHVLLILLLNLNSLTIFKYNIINSSKMIPSFQSYTCISQPKFSSC